MRMWRIGPDGHVNRHRRPRAPCLKQDAGRCMFRGRQPIQRFAQRFARTRPGLQRRIPFAPRFFCGPEASVGQHGFHILARLAHQRNLEIVDRRRTVHCKPGCETAPHQVDQHRRKAALHHVPAHAPQDRFALVARRQNRSQNGAKRISRQDMRQALKQAFDPRAALVHTREIALSDLPPAFFQ